MNELETNYQYRYENILQPISASLETDFRRHLADCKRIDRISVRVKDPLSFFNKAKKVENGNPKYIDPLNQIQDQIGVRIIVIFHQDVEIVCNEVLKVFRPIEDAMKTPQRPDSFSYEGRHFILRIPKEVIPNEIVGEKIPTFFELQVKTVFQHAWAEAEHDISYKAPAPLTHEQKRMCAYAAAQAWGADRIFEDLFNDLCELESNPIS